MGVYCHKKNAVELKKSPMMTYDYPMTYCMIILFYLASLVPRMMPGCTELNGRVSDKIFICSWSVLTCSHILTFEVGSISALTVTIGGPFHLLLPLKQAAVVQCPILQLVCGLRLQQQSESNPTTAHTYPGTCSTEAEKVKEDFLYYFPACNKCCRARVCCRGPCRTARPHAGECCWGLGRGNTPGLQHLKLQGRINIENLDWKTKD